MIYSRLDNTDYSNHISVMSKPTSWDSTPFAVLLFLPALIRADPSVLIASSAFPCHPNPTPPPSLSFFLSLIGVKIKGILVELISNSFGTLDYPQILKGRVCTLVRNFTLFDSLDVGFWWSTSGRQSWLWETLVEVLLRLMEGANGCFIELQWLKRLTLLHTLVRACVCEGIYVCEGMC